MQSSKYRYITRKLTVLTLKDIGIYGNLTKMLETKNTSKHSTEENINFRLNIPIIFS